MRASCVITGLIMAAQRLCIMLCISVIVCLAVVVHGEKKVEETFMKKITKDLDTSATGYIYQQQGNSPASVIYLNKGDVLGNLNQGEVLGRLNQGEVLHQLNQGEVLPHLHLKMNHGVIPAQQASLPYVYQQSANGVNNPGRSTSQAYYVTHYQDYGDGGKKYNTNRPSAHYNKAIGESYPHYDVVKSSYGVYNPLALAHLPKHPKKTLGLGHYPTVAQHAESEEVDEGDEEEDDDDDDEAPVAHLHQEVDDDNSGEEIDDDDDGPDSHESYQDELHHSLNSPIATYTHGGYGHNHGHDNDRGSHQASDGSEHNEEHHASHGEKGSKGYDKHQESDKGEKGHYDEADHAKHYNQNSGHKASGHDEGKQYHAHHEADKGEKGGEFQEKKAHKKGQKTTGYHNVFHKDEYKKVHTFYDDADHKGKFKKYGAEHKEHESKAGESKKGAHHQSGHESDQKGKKGHSSKGHHDANDQGYKKEHGKEQFHENEAEYAKKGGKQGESSHAYTDGGHY